VNRVGVLYEWEPWAARLLDTLEGRGFPVERLPADSLVVDPGRIPNCAVFVNRVNVQPAGGTDPRFVFQVLGFLEELEQHGAKILNGSRAFRAAMSKSLQASIFAKVEVPFPVTKIVASPSRAVEISKTLEFPVIVKPNIGGSGAGVRIFDGSEELQEAVREGLSFGVDGVGLLQEYHPPADGLVRRIEVLDGEILYGTRQAVMQGVFNYCAIDGCSVGGDPKGSSIESFEPPKDLAALSIRVAKEAEADVAGVEFVTSSRDGRTYAFDINPYSNLAAPDVVGFEPHELLADAVARRLQ